MTKDGQGKAGRHGKATPGLPVTVVVPCFNEVDGLYQLIDRLRGLADQADHDFRFIFVNDGSKDGTGDALERVADGWARASVIHHESNRGITAAILTGIRHADTEIVCSIDSDCTYDPQILAAMVPLLAPHVALVTASPYHPDGRVANVPRWRLALSRAASWLYRRVVYQSLHTYTSCCRTYRRSAVLELPEIHPGFEGVAELLARLDQAGWVILERPATLQARKFGQSKLRVLQCMVGHLRVLARLAGERWLVRGACASKDGPHAPAAKAGEAPTRSLEWQQRMAA